ncbi:MAG: hypothetical protein HGA97_09785 [Chlorobiaceae bacterium]|nr:hypothetical protein [Chlorobiaceae bacterium]
MATNVKATVLTFDTSYTPEITLSSDMRSSDTGGGHLFNEAFTTDDQIFFSLPTYVNDFQMNALPYEGYEDLSGNIDIAALE